LLDDREERPGVMFSDQELIGIPHRVVVGERSLREYKLEYQGRRDECSRLLPLTEALAFIAGMINQQQ